MGTRSLTHIKDDGGKTLVTIYRQYDGYPTGQGQDIKNVLSPRKLVNGYTDVKTQTNGMGCAAALLIAGLKDGCGNVYIYPPDTEDVWQDYTYTLYSKEGEFYIKIEGYDSSQFYDGPLSLADMEEIENQE